MPTVHKIRNDDGSYTVMANGQPVRSTLDSFEADEVVRSLSYVNPDEDEQAGQTLFA